MTSPSVSEFAPPVGADASAKGSHQEGKKCRLDVSEVRQGLSDTDREQAICRAAALIEFFHAEYRCHEALWHRNGDFGSKAAFDLAYSNAHKARELMESLIRGRSAEMVAYLERQKGLDLPACANEERAN